MNHRPTATKRKRTPHTSKKDSVLTRLVSGHRQRLETYPFIDRLVRSPAMQKAMKWLLGPALLYFVIFFLMQPGYIGHFSDGFFLDDGDGFQNVWNIWWVNESLEHLQQNPYFTTMLHWPHGVTLIPQTMNIINGLMGIPLMNGLGFSLVQVVNFAVVFSFVVGGVTMLWFIQKLHGRYWVSLVAGGLFTFSSYHFAHAQGHLQLVSLEFIPLFLLSYWLLIEKMRYRYAMAAAGSLFLVLLCDYYYFFWSVLLGGLWFGWQLWRKRLTITKQHIKVFATFLIAAGTLTAPLVLSLLSLTKHDPLLGSHDSREFSLDPVSIFMPGGSWYWHSLTDWYTTNLAYFAEASMFFGFALLAVLVTVAYRCFVARKKLTLPENMWFWGIVMLGFAILALGPRLKIAGHTLDSISLPYAAMERLFPTLRLSGMPMRWLLISLIAAIVIAAWFLARADLSRRRNQILVGLFIMVSFIDLWPRQLPLTSPATQPYVTHLKALPAGGVIDNGALSGAEQLYNQTVHGHPISFGYTTRVPQSVDTKDFLIFAALEEKRYDQLCREFRVRYVTMPVTRPMPTTYPVIYQDKQTLIYDFKNSSNC